MKKNLLKISLILILSGFISCSGGGGGSDSGGGSACSVLNAKVFNGETCNQDSDNPVLAIVAFRRVGEEIEAASICTGTMVTSDDFVTSAHCLSEVRRELGSSLAGFGAFFKLGSEEAAVTIVSRFSSHPRYNGQAASPFDIAMGTLREVPEGVAFGPVPFILSSETKAGDEVTSFGYGTNNSGGEGTLKALKFKVENVEDGNIFASLSNAGASICQGDSGGPLIKVTNGVTGIVGVNSFGTATSEECASSGSDIFGFVNVQNPGIIEFISGYAGDVAVR